MKRSATLLCLLILFAGCTPSTQPPQQQNGPAELQAFASPADLRQYLLAQYPSFESMGPLETLVRNLLGIPLPGTSIAPYYYPGSAAPYDPLAAGLGGFAGTDPQALRAGEIEPARLVGDRLFVLTQFGLTILQATPADQMAVLGRFLTSSAPSGLYPLDAGRLALLTSHQTPYYYPYDYTDSDIAWLPNADPYFDVYVLDVNDATAPSALARYSIQGEPIASRVVGGTRLTVLSVSYPAGTAYGTMRDITHIAVANLLPTWRLTDAAGSQAVKPLLTWDQVLRPANPDGGAILTLSTIDLTSPGAAPEAVAMVGYWDMAYATPTSVYLTNTAWPADGSYRNDTELHRFDITGQAPRYAGSVKLSGRPLWKGFSEKDGLLRVTTSDASPYYYTEPEAGVITSLFVLGDSGAGLEVIGRLENINIEPGTQVYGIEYMGDYAGLSGSDDSGDVSILVDLTDPHNPASLGRTSISPYAGYLHMLDATHALAIGSIPDDPDDFSSFSGEFTLMMYDIAAGATLAHSHVVGTGGTSSTIHYYRDEAFLSNGLLILPISLYEGTIPDSLGQLTFGGLYLYRIAPESGFTPLGRIETADPYTYAAWHRAIVNNGILYAVTNATVQAAAVNAPGQVLSKVRLP